MTFTGFSIHHLHDITPLIARLEEETFTIGAEIRPIKEFTIDAIVIPAPQIKNFTINALLLQVVKTFNFTINVVIVAVNTKSFEVDALIVTDQMKDFLINGIVKSIGGESGSFIPADFVVDAQLTQDGVIKLFLIDAELRATKSVEVNAILIVRKTFDFNIDAQLTGTTIKIFTIDALLEELDKTKDFTIQGILLQTVPEGFFVDSLIANDFATNGGPTITKYFLVDAFKQATFDKDLTINAKLNRQVQYEVDALLLKTQTETFSIDTLIANDFDTNGGTEITKYYLIDSCIRGEKTLEFTIDSILTQEGTIVFLIDAILTGLIQKPFTIDAIINDEAPVPFNFTIDAQIGSAIICTLACVELPPAPPVKQFTIDAFLVAPNQVQFTIDAKIVRISPFVIDAVIIRAVQFLIDAQIASPNTKIFLIDAVLKQTNTRADIRIDALLSLKDQTKIFIVDAQLAGANTEIFTIDAVLKGAIPFNFTIDARVGLVGVTKTFTIDAVVFAQLKEFTIDAILEKGTRTEIFFIDAQVGETVKTICDFETVIFPELEVESEFL